MEGNRTRVEIRIKNGKVDVHFPDGQQLGKKCTEIANILMGKHGKIVSTTINKDFNYEQETEVEVQTILR